MKNNIAKIIFCFLLLTTAACSKKTEQQVRVSSPKTLATTNAIAGVGQTVTLAANKGYAEPYSSDAGTLGIQLDNNADSATISNWTNAATSVNWYLYLSPATLKISINATLPSGQANSFKFYFIKINSNNQTDSVTVNITGSGSAQDYVLNSNVVTNASTFYKFRLQPVSKSGSQFATINLLKVTVQSGSNVTVRNAKWMSSPSVHVAWNPSNGNNAHDWFYSEIQVPVGYDPVYTYWESIGVNRGYMGMQRNFDNEKRIIFSAWDADDAGEAPASMYKTKILDNGTGVVTDAFGGEGTGGHSHLVYNWQTGSTVKFLHNARKIGDHDIIYSAWWSDASNPTWQYMASFDLPYDNDHLNGGFYGFVENFGPASGSAIRKGFFQNSWGHILGGAWEKFVNTSFSYTDGASDSRSDFASGLDPNDNSRVYLQTAGYLNPNWVNTATISSSTSSPSLDTSTLKARVDQALHKANPLIPGAIYELKSALDVTKNLDVYGGFTANETNVEIYSDNSANNQRWLFQYVSAGYFKLIPRNATDKCLDVYGGYSTSGTNVQIYTANGGNSQKWYFTALSNGYYKIQPACAPSLCLNAVSSGSGANVNVTTDDGSINQQWKLDIIL